VLFGQKIIFSPPFLKEEEKGKKIKRGFHPLCRPFPGIFGFFHQEFFETLEKKIVLAKHNK